jgi:hypothetical protein
MSYCVFQYETEINIEDVRKSLVDMVFRCLESNKPITKAEFYARIPKLLSGSYPERAGKSVRTSLDALLWKYTELTGKYCGCQYWSAKAKSLFDQELREKYCDSPSMKDACLLANCLCKKGLLDDKRFEHEHVFPKKALIKLLRGLPESSISSDKIGELLDRLAVACVVLGSEHRSVNSVEENSDNPWLRYKGEIRLVPNLDWTSSQRVLIERAGLV